MPDTKLTNLPAGAALSPTDLFYSVQGTGSVKVTAGQIQTFVGGGPPHSYTVATLPAAPIGTMAIVIDGMPSQAWASTIVGGGSSRYLVWFNGLSWTVIGDGGYTAGLYITVYLYYGYG